MIRLFKELKRENFSHVYDAHSNLRSHILCGLLRLFQFRIQFVRRSKERFKRFLLFQLRLNYFPKPFKGAESYLQPIRHWLSPQSDLKLNEPPNENMFNFPVLRKKYEHSTPSVLLAPSATWELKRWPTENWKKLIALNPNTQFTIVGGPKDDFCSEIKNQSPDRVQNLAGQISWLETVKLVHDSQVVISGDTGVLHIADLLGKPCIALIGPTAFGYPSRKTSKVVEENLSCKPCTKDGRGRCRNTTYKMCMLSIAPERVSQELAKMF